MPQSSLEQLSVDTIRTLSMDAVQKATCGHPGMPMGMADAAYVLWTKFLRHDPKDPKWFDRDRFVLSAGHGSMLLYSLLFLTGYNLSLDELKQFRQWGSKTPGHPEYGLTEGVETTTGPLGQGFATGVGMALAEAHLAEHFNQPDHKVVDHYTYGIVSDGDLMEGISHEAASLAGHLKLGKLIYLYDNNHISIDGNTQLSFTEDVIARFKAYGWHTQSIDGHDRKAVEEAINEAQSVYDKPSIIACRTHIGYGSPNKHDSAAAHGSALGEDEVRLTKKNLGWDPDKHFYVPEEVKKHYEEAIQRGREWNSEWKQSLAVYRDVYKEEAAEFDHVLSGKLPEGWDKDLPVFPADAKGLATRKASGKVLNVLRDRIPNLIGGSADLTPSNNTYMEGTAEVDAGKYDGRYVHYGVREHAMSAALNGMTLHGGVIAYGGTFMIFSDYARPSLRIAALCEIPTIFVYTHDSIGLGEDGPTHQPIEHLMALRAMPHLHVVRPADANETTFAWKHALQRKNGPTALILTRQNLPVYEQTANGAAADLEKGAYILQDAPNGDPKVILLSTGSEVSIAMEAWQKLSDEGIPARVVSMPCWKLFEAQDKSYRDKVLPPAVKARISIEAGATLGWYKWIGENGVAIGLDHFGASAPYKEIYEGFGITAEHVVEAAHQLTEVVSK
ncbi:MAG TPA: transketolase [Balneolales bacterium]|nr:transketolase [Balneolales bacterium]